MSDGVFEGRKWLARIRAGKRLDGPIVGTAFAIGSRHLMTCAHVAHAAGAAGPGSQVMIDLLFDGPRTLLATLLQEGWRGVPDSTQAQSAGDTAVLEIPESADPLTPLPLANRRTLLHTAVETYGFPVAHPESNSARGVLGRSVGLEWMMIEQHPATLIEPGFSGAPVWSDEIGAAIGMIVTRDSSGVRSAYAVPVGKLRVGNRHVESAIDKSPLAWRHHVASGLRNLILNQDALLADRARGFIGRRKLQATIRTWLRDPDFYSGYIFIEGAAGIGKSAVAANISLEYGYPNHFNEYAPNIRSPGLFLRNICAQLIARYELPYANLPPDAESSAAFLLFLMEKAQKTVDEPVVILVDALDEAEPAVGNVNRLNLPSQLPRGCFVVATNRLGVDRQIDASSARNLELLETSAENEADIRAFVLASLDGHAADRTDLPPRSEVADAIWTKSEGNFMYAKHALAEILAIAGTREPADVMALIDSLPKGLIPYYERQWRLMQSSDERRLRQIQEPIIFFLAVAHEAVTAGMISDWMNESGLGPVDEFTIGNVLTREWGQFICVEPGLEKKYRPYHQRFLEFLQSKIEFDRYRRLVAAAMRNRVNFDGLL